jgi:hypothetical protein
MALASREYPALLDPDHGVTPSPTDGVLCADERPFHALLSKSTPREQVPTQAPAPPLRERQATERSSGGVHGCQLLAPAELDEHFLQRANGGWKELDRQGRGVQELGDSASR